MPTFPENPTANIVSLVAEKAGIAVSLNQQTGEWTYQWQNPHSSEAVSYSGILPGRHQRELFKQLIENGTMPTFQVSKPQWAAMCQSGWPKEIVSLGREEIRIAHVPLVNSNPTQTQPLNDFDGSSPLPMPKAQAAEPKAKPAHPDGNETTTLVEEALKQDGINDLMLFIANYTHLQMKDGNYSSDQKQAWVNFCVKALKGVFTGGKTIPEIATMSEAAALYPRPHKKTIAQLISRDINFWIVIFHQIFNVPINVKKWSVYSPETPKTHQVLTRAANAVAIAKAILNTNLAIPAPLSNLWVAALLGQETSLLGNHYSLTQADIDDLAKFKLYCTSMPNLSLENLYVRVMLANIPIPSLTEHINRLSEYLQQARAQGNLGSLNPNRSKALRWFISLPPETKNLILETFKKQGTVKGLKALRNGLTDRQKSSLPKNFVTVLTPIKDMLVESVSHMKPEAILSNKGQDINLVRNLLVQAYHNLESFPGFFNSGATDTLEQIKYKVLPRNNGVAPEFVILSEREIPIFLFIASKKAFDPIALRHDFMEIHHDPRLVWNKPWLAGRKSS